MRTTFMEKTNNVDRKWYIVDATGMTVGRLSSAVAFALIGKHKPTYTPHIDCGDNIVIINADKVKFTGDKLSQKKYYRHSNHPGGLKETSVEKMMETYPERVLEHSIKGMLPKNRLGRQMYKKLFVYAGSEHPHAAQKPEQLNDDFKNWFVK